MRKNINEILMSKNINETLRYEIFKITENIKKVIKKLDNEIESVEKDKDIKIKLESIEKTESEMKIDADNMAIVNEYRNKILLSKIIQIKDKKEKCEKLMEILKKEDDKLNFYI